MDQIESSLRAFLRITSEQSLAIDLPRIIANVCECAQLTFRRDSGLSFTSAMTIKPMCKAAAGCIVFRLGSTNSRPAIQIEQELEGLVGGWLLESQPRPRNYTEKPKLVAPQSPDFV